MTITASPYLFAGLSEAVFGRFFVKALAARALLSGGVSLRTLPHHRCEDSIKAAAGNVKGESAA